MKTKVLFLFTVMLTTVFPTANSQSITLPAPDRAGGVPLMQALNERASSREFDSRPLTDQQLSNLLWAAWGINRPADGKHTAPSSNNRQEMAVYVAMQSGLYLFNPENHTLEQVLSADIRKASGRQDFVGTAPVNLIFVADLIKAGVRNPEEAGPESLNTSYINTGFMAQNVYLYCASAKLACVVRGYFDREVLTKAMELKPHQRIIITQTVGHPKD
ncbi:MAG: SagB/ThcOx family dehydrogenase [Bacteroidales bacterium]